MLPNKNIRLWETPSSSKKDIKDCIFIIHFYEDYLISVIYNKKTKLFSSLFTYPITTKTQNELELKQLFESTILPIANSYPETHIIIDNKIYKAIPKELFDPLKINTLPEIKTLYNNGFKRNVNSIENHNIINLFFFTPSLEKIISSIKNYKIWHSSTIHLNLNLKKQDSEKNQVSIYLKKESFDIIISKEKKLQLANSFEFENNEELIYYLIFCLKQEHIKPTELTINVFGELQEKSIREFMLTKYIKKINLWNPELKNKIPSKINLYNFLIPLSLPKYVLQA